MVPISSKRRQSTNNESQAIISAKSKKMIEVVSSNSHNTQDVDKTTISSHHTNQTQTTTTVKCCSICNKNNAKYKCPNCNISYCSVSCYQIHDGTSSSTSNTTDHCSNNSNTKLCTESFYKRQPTNSIDTNNIPNRVQSVLSNIHNEININLDKLEKRNEHISKLINENDSDGGEIVNGMIEEIKDNVCKSNRAMDVFRIDQLNNSKEVEEVVHEISIQEDRVPQQDNINVRVKKDELSIGMLISGITNVLDSNDNTDDVLSTGILNLGLGNSDQIRPLVVEERWFPYQLD